MAHCLLRIAHFFRKGQSANVKESVAGFPYKKRINKK
jgi:hypothetical protein